MKPLQQLFGLALEHILENPVSDGKGRKTGAMKEYKREMAKLEKETPNLETFMKKKEKYCSAKIKALLFDKFLIKIENKRNGMKSILSYL